MIGKGGITLYHMVSVSYGHRMGMVWYEWAAKECISMSDNQRFGSAGWAEQGTVQGSAAILDKIRAGPRDGGKKEIH